MFGTVQCDRIWIFMVKEKEVYCFSVEFKRNEINVETVVRSALIKLT